MKNDIHNGLFQIGAKAKAKATFAQCLLLAILLITLAALAPGAHAQANVQGTWTTLTSQMQINPVHTALMHNGKILIVSGSGNYPAQTIFQVGVWDPSNNTMTVGTQSWDQFCNGIAVFPDGRPFIVGGNLKYDPFFGYQRTTVYDPSSGAYTDMEDMFDGRWYPTDTILGDGRLLTIGGLNLTGGTNTTTEIYKVGAGWSAPAQVPFIPPLYPRMHVLPNGTVFYSGSTTQSRTFDPSNSTWSNVIATTNYSGTRTYGSSVLLPLTPANGYAPKVMIFGGGNPSTNTTEIIDLSAPTPAWVYGPNMAQPRIEMNAVLLPTGKILTVGGSLNDEDTSTASLQADLYDIAGNTMGSAGSNGFARLYHSVALLLPDGTVWVAGGNPTRGTFEPHVEIYTPPYLFQPNGTPAVRPTISALSTNVVGYGSSFTVTTPDAANIATAILMKNGADTHAFDMEQRAVGLSFTAGAGSLTVTGPPNGNTAPPGYYMLFLINNAGVPSVAQFVQISATPADVAPTGSITTPAADVAIQPGQSVTFAGSGTATAGAITAYSWSIRGSATPTSAAQNPGVVTFNNPGVYKAILTVTDTAGNTDPTPPTRTITVSSNPAPTLTGVAPVAALQGATNVNVVIAGSHFLTGATCDFGAGIEVNTCTFNSAAQLTANIDVLSSAVNGPRDVTVTNTDQQSGLLTGGFTVQAGTALPAPTLTAVTPNSAYQGTSSVAVVLTGTNFRPNPTCSFNTDFGGVNNTCTYMSPTEIDAAVSVDLNAQLGGHNVVVTNADGQSATFVNAFTVTQNLGPTVELGNGFTTGSVVLNGSAQLNGTSLQLTDDNPPGDEAGSAWYATPVNVSSFISDFTFQITPGQTADGFTFTLQGNNTAALGPFGGGLGYGPTLLTDPPGILKSVAVKFDLYSNFGEGVDSTGLYVNGVSPSTPAVDMTASGVDLHNGDIFAVHMLYDGTNLTMTITDTTTNATFTHSWAIDIPGTVGAQTAYVGFTGGTGGLFALQDILTWTYGATTGLSFNPAAPLTFPDTTTSVASQPVTVTVKNNGPGTATISGITVAGANPTDFALSADTCTGQPVAVNGTCTVAVTFTPGGTGERDGLLQFAGIPCEPPQTLQLTGNGVAPSTPGATITPTSPIAFPNTAQAVASSPVTVTVTNSGNANLVISTVTVGGTNAGDFSLTANTCNGATVAANATCTVGVIFTPGALGVRMATLNVADNAPATPQSAALSGTGVAAAPVVSVTPTGGVNFPNTVQGQTATAIVQTITNTGNATLTLSSITKTGANPGDFAISQNTCTATLAVNANCQVSITFTPTTTGARTANLSIADNATGSPQLVSLTGTGTPVNAPVVTFTPSGTIGFPSTAQGSTSSPIAVTIGNTGGAILNISGIALGGTSAGDFAIASNNCGATLAASASCMVSLTFKPTATGVRTAALVVTDNAAGSPQMAVLSGTGTAAGAAAVTITPNPIPAFTATQGTQSSATTVTITNSGGSTFTFAANSISIAGTNAADFSIVANSSTCGATLAASASCTVGVVFAPLASGNRSATFQVAYGAANPQTAVLSGTAAAAFTLTSASSAQSATVTAGQAATYNLQITPGSGFTGSVMWACTGAPSGAACTVTPNPVPLSGGTAASFTVSVTTTARSMLLPPVDRRPMPPTSPLVMLERLLACLALLALISELKRRGGLTSRQMAYIGGALLLAVTLYGLSGCGGGSSGGGGGGGGTVGTQAGTYTLTLTPTATSVNTKPLTLSPVSLTLVVN